MTSSSSAVVDSTSPEARLDGGRLFGDLRRTSASTALAIVHLLVNLPLGIAYFTALSAGVSLGVGLLITLLGIPVLIGTAWLVRSLGHLERARCNAFLGTTLRDPYRPAAPDAGWVARLFAIGADPATWRDFLFLLLRLPMGLLSFTLTIAAWLLAIGLLGSPIAYLFDGFRVGVGPVWLDGPLGVVVATLAGVVMLALAYGITRGLAALDVVLANALLDASPEELKRRVSEIAGSRSRTVSAADQERRRLERDLHDGAQQRLVSLAMTLGLARQKLDTDRDQGRRLVTEAHEEAKRALQDLRDLARGLHPAVLTDHGLDAALPALAARCPIPTRVDAVVSPRPAPAVESAAYFVVAEALTNVARHAQAGSVEVTAHREDDVLTIEIRDDGVGGTAMTEGGGLAGLADRVDALDGRLTVSSPRGGPTVVRMEVPCGQ